jgi:hypothetical protein
MAVQQIDPVKEKYLVYSDPARSFRLTSLSIYISCKIKISIPHLEGVLKICPMSEQVIKQSVVYS